MAVVVGGLGGVARGDGTVRFSRDVRPVLSQNCYLCHGLDETRREAGLRLDVRESAVGELDSGVRAIVPGKPDESELIARVSTDDPDLRMPPTDGPHKPLKPEQIAVLRQWIAEGAKYEGHWSFTAPVRPAVPQATPEAWIRNPIDAFVLARLNSEGLEPSPEADRRTLIRRLSLDLTGLPPTLGEVQEFLADERPDAYERLVDRLLASPHYGERMAMEWLDAARYADTHGYHIDSQRDMWVWRDWVIKAYNENLPFDEFTKWQLAGDLLPEATTEQKIASGFNRNHAINFEGGAIPEEYHTEYVIDRVSTTGTVWMGLTLGCARCHDHKYDPITQKEFFQLYAFFNTVDEQGLDGYRGNAKPMMEAPTAEQERRRGELDGQIAALEMQLAELEPTLVEQEHAWIAARAQQQTAESAVVTASDWSQLGAFNFDTPEAALEASLVETPVRLDAKTTYQGKEFSWKPAPHIADGSVNANLPAVEPGVVYLVRTLTAREATTVPVHVGTGDAIEVWLNGERVWGRVDPMAFGTRQKMLDLKLAAGENQVLVKLMNYAWEWQFAWAFDATAGVAPAPHIENLIALTERDEKQAATLRSYFRANVAADEAYRSAALKLATLVAERATLASEIATTMVMHEMAEPRKSFRLERGQYNAPAEEVTPATPAALPSLPADGPANRLALAEWLVSGKHPLTARVTVNRLWQMLFGTGLVKTSEDFGLQGQWPTHPELLDWLATEFVDSGWDVKHMVRLMATSAAYRQASAAGAELVARDPENQLVARGARFRMPAEMVRDVAMAASGLLVDRIGGPSVKPYSPGDLWGELAHQKSNYKFTAQLYEQDHGEALYRRGMYTFWKRSVPAPNLNAFDAPSRETCIVRRERTNTPLQALVLLNDPTFVEAGRALAQRMLETHSGDARAAIEYGFELVTARRPTAEELSILAKEYENQLAGFRETPHDAEALLGVGESARDVKLDAPAHAAMTNVAIVMLNLDEAITKD